MWSENLHKNVLSGRVLAEMSNNRNGKKPLMFPAAVFRCHQQVAAFHNNWDTWTVVERSRDWRPAGCESIISIIKLKKNTTHSLWMHSVLCVRLQPFWWVFQVSSCVSGDTFQGVWNVWKWLMFGCSLQVWALDHLFALSNLSFFWFPWSKNNLMLELYRITSFVCSTTFLIFGRIYLTEG